MTDDFEPGLFQHVNSKRLPMRHQARAIDLSLNKRDFAIFFEQRCGKTKVVIDTASYHFQRGTIDACVIIAWPNGVQNVWGEEWPKDWPDELPYKMIVWRSGKMGGVQAKADLEALLTTRSMAVIAINCDAMNTDSAWKYLSRFWKRRRVMCVADESSWAKSPNSARTKRLLALGRQPQTELRRILDGTPADEGPLDLYAPCAFLNPNLLGYKNFFLYKARFAKLEEGYGRGGRTFKKVVGFQNLEELNTKLANFSIRVRRADVSDAPAKVYQSRYFTLTDKQREVYDGLRDEYIATMAAGTVEHTVENVLKRMIRLQMIARNYYPPEEVGTYCEDCVGDECERCGGLGVYIHTTRLERIDPDSNPAQEALTLELQATRAPAVIWAQFRQDVSDAVEASAQAGRRVARYDGSVPAKKREELYHAFREGDFDDIVATIGSGLSRGHDLTRAGAVIYYSNSFALRARRQSEDRAEGLSRTISTDVVDLIAEDTRDVQIINALREKKSIAEFIVGDPPEKWI